MATLASSLARSLLTMSLIAGCSRQTSPEDPGLVLDELLSADRQFAAASAESIADKLGAMFAADVEVRSPGGMIRGRESAIAELRKLPDNQPGSRIEWAPIRGGLSADGRHGFTFGYMTVTLPDSTTVPLKYLAYWIREPEGWRVRVYRRGRRPEGPVSMDMLPAALPSAIVPVSADSNRIGEHARSLDAAERAFSDRAGVIGLGPAFREFGSADAMNMGGPADTAFVLGADAIGNAVGGGEPAGPSSVTWAPDHVIVASSGDFGVTVGTIVAPSGTDAPAREIPFFTIWRRASTSAPWRYVAE